MSERVANRLKADLVNHAEWPQRHMRHRHPGAVNLIMAGDVPLQERDRLNQQSLQQGIEDIAGPFLSHRNRNQIQFSCENCQQVHHVGGRPCMSADVDGAGKRDRRMEVQRREPGRAGQLATELTGREIATGCDKDGGLRRGGFEIAEHVSFEIHDFWYGFDDQICRRDRRLRVRRECDAPQHRFDRAVDFRCQHTGPGGQILTHLGRGGVEHVLIQIEQHDRAAIGGGVQADFSADDTRADDHHAGERLVATRSGLCEIVGRSICGSLRHGNAAIRRKVCRHDVRGRVRSMGPDTVPWDRTVVLASKKTGGTGGREALTRYPVRRQSRDGRSLAQIVQRPAADRLGVC